MVRRKREKPLSTVVLEYELYITAAFFAFIFFLWIIYTLSHCMPLPQRGIVCIETPSELNPFAALEYIDFTSIILFIWVIGGIVMIISYFLCKQHEIAVKSKRGRKRIKL